jgi:hypothetical protein
MQTDNSMVFITPDFFVSAGNNIDLYKALAAFQAELQPVGHDAQNTFKDYTYAKLDHILKEIVPLLCKHGLTLSQPSGRDAVVTMVTHAATGQFIGSITPIIMFDAKGMTPMQILGTGITYARRYALSILNISTTADDDGTATGVVEDRKSKKNDTSAKPISKEQAKAIINRMTAMGYDEQYLNKAVGAALKDGNATIYSLPLTRLDPLLDWVVKLEAEKSKNSQTDEVTV